jgi:diguanylate cyclase (GGDEF)-like protein
MTYHSQALSLNGLAAEINLLDPDLPVSVAVTDLDGFGPLNAAHGTEAGDAVLGSFEQSLAAGLPQGALIAHSRGDEFAVALPDASCEEALLALEAVRAGFAASEPVPGLNERLGVTIGIAGRPAHGSTAEELLEAADAGLVRGKPDRDPRRGAHDPEEQLLSPALAAPPDEAGPPDRAAGSQPAARGAGRLPGPQSRPALAGR